MSVREIRLFGDPVLRSACRAVTDLESVRGLVEDLLETTKLPGRAGVAANQIGVDLRVFSYNVHGEVGYLINPEIIDLQGDPQLTEEGCLSLPGLWHKTPRYPIATARGQQLDGSIVEVSGTGLMAQALQHECDHLDGKVYIDRLLPEERKLAFRALREQSWFMAN
ncbi:peptide deformylase [Aquiluna sp. KACHI24]|uniref:peptide deformylase n=1 Tax=Aquiluna sp. KACHI24 TaxID=2968831 RepID=UPI002203B242|nr:peptide deformylase [Aquiluna sp. KACHI24]BDQ00165.1 peptide deformylase 2 [Aquiluna sp. KACHI24]